MATAFLCLVNAPLMNATDPKNIHLQMMPVFWGMEALLRNTSKSATALSQVSNTTECTSGYRERDGEGGDNRRWTWDPQATQRPWPRDQESQLLLPPHPAINQGSIPGCNTVPWLGTVVLNEALGADQCCYSPQARTTDGKSVDSVALDSLARQHTGPLSGRGFSLAAQSGTALA